jgi:hypothetical protein
MTKFPRSRIAATCGRSGEWVLTDPRRVARWFVFKPKIPIWVNFGGTWIGKCLYILWPLGISYGDLGYFMTIWYILYSFGTFCIHWVHFVFLWYIFPEEKSRNPGSP